MTQTDITVNPGASGWPYPDILQEKWRTWAFRRLNAAFTNALRLPFTDSSRFVLFSDLHRGDGGPRDRFQPNKQLFLQALRFYYENGYTYIEVGDGDELWLHNDLRPIVQAHMEVFEWLHRFEEDGRLYILYGNHDITSMGNCPPYKDGILTHEALVLQHHKSQRLFICHGHQADLTNAHLYGLTRFANRYLWQRLPHGIDLASTSKQDGMYAPNIIRQFFQIWFYQQPRFIESRLKEWAAQYRRTIICGHTHRAATLTFGEGYYLNTGNCLVPNRLSGSEITNGQLYPVIWYANKDIFLRIKGGQER